MSPKTPQVPTVQHEPSRGRAIGERHSDDWLKKWRSVEDSPLLTCWQTSAIFCKTQNLIKKLPSSFHPMVESLSTISIFHISFKFIQLYFWKSFCRLPPTFLPHLLSQKYSLIENGTLKASTLLIKILGVQKKTLGLPKACKNLSIWQYFPSIFSRLHLKLLFSVLINRLFHSQENRKI